MPARPEPFLAERVWAHPSTLAQNGVTWTVELDAAQRPAAVHYSDGNAERYRYDADGRVVEIDEHPMLWSTIVGPARRWDSGGLLHVEQRAADRVRHTREASVSTPSPVRSASATLRPDIDITSASAGPRTPGPYPVDQSMSVVAFHCRVIASS